MVGYSEILKEHYLKPRNVGIIEGADGIGKIGSRECGDYFEFYIKVKDNIITEAKYKVFGCGAAIGLCSIVSEMAIGKTLGEALQITDERALQAAGGLPDNKVHCSNYAASALHLAIKDYYRRVFANAGIKVD
ncbi:MAG TPA: iron-sulfur cluster assembly scaffold protein [bacterium]|nr:iron-sulfur cluster assembly scaffold protein [bacterium]